MSIPESESRQQFDDAYTTNRAAWLQWLTAPALDGVALPPVPRHRAEDLVQNALLSAWEKRATFDATKGNLAEWLTGYVHMALRDSRKRSAVERKHISLTPVPSTDAEAFTHGMQCAIPADADRRAEAGQLAARLLAQATPDVADAIIRRVEREPWADIARSWSLDTNTLKQRVSRYQSAMRDKNSVTKSPVRLRVSEPANVLAA